MPEGNVGLVDSRGGFEASQGATPMERRRAFAADPQLLEIAVKEALLFPATRNAIRAARIVDGASERNSGAPRGDQERIRQCHRAAE